MAHLIETLLRLDRNLFVIINSVQSRAWDYVFGYGTLLGLGLTLTILLFVGFRLFDRRRFPLNFIVVALALAFAALCNSAVKQAVRRPRPMVDPAFSVSQEIYAPPLWPGWLSVRYYVPSEDAVGDADVRLKTVGPRFERKSFPSGHTAAAFATAAGFIYVSRRRRKWLFLLPAAFVGVSRIACGVHFPLDVAAGALIGATVSTAFLRAFEIFHGLGSYPGRYPRKKRAEGPYKIMMVVGEASADVYGSRVVEELKLANSTLVAYGIGGERMKAAGFRCDADAHELSIVGFTAVIASLATIVRLFRNLVRRLREDPPDALVCIDLPDFNIMLAAQARARSIPVLFYVSPQFWAWRAGRVAKMASKVSKMIVAFLFEKPYYERENVPVAFYGHPILEVLHRRFEDPAAAKAHFGINPAHKLLVLAPGSRRNEFKYIRDEMFQAGRTILKAFPGWRAAVPLAPGASEKEMADAAHRASLPIIITHGDNFDLFACADFGLICSGTATLEAALAGLPMIVVYRGNRLNFEIARRLVTIDRIGLPNIILGGESPAFPEMIQDEALAAPLAAKAVSILRDQGEYARLQAACGAVRRALEGGDTSARVARDILDLANQ